MVRVFIAVSLLLALSGACGDDAKTVTARDEPNGAPRTGCVTEEEDPTDENSTDSEALGGQQSALQGDIEALQAYGREHPDEYTSVRYDNYPTVKLVAYFTDRLDEHRAALAARLEHDTFELRRSVQSEREAQAVQDALDEPDLAHFYEHGPDSNGVVVVNFRATRAGRDAAAAAHARWGERVCVSVSNHPYPRGSRPDHRTCPETLPRDRVAGVEVQLVLTTTTIAAGERGTGVARITNRGTAPIDRTTATTLDAAVLVAGTDEIVGRLGGMRTQAGLGVHIDPGQTLEIPVQFGTDECRADRGYALPAGDYVVSYHDEHFGRSDDVALTVTD